MTWTLNAYGHFQPETDDGSKEAFVESVREALRALSQKPSYATLNWSLGDDQEQINVTPEQDG